MKKDAAAAKEKETQTDEKGFKQTKYGTAAIKMPDPSERIYQAVAELPDDFPFDQWDDMTTAQQKQIIETTDLSKAEQWVILNAALPIGTLREIQEYQNTDDGVWRTQAEKDSFLDRIWEAGSAIYSIKNHNHPLSYDRFAENILLDMIYEDIGTLMDSVEGDAKESDYDRILNYYGFESREEFRKEFPHGELRADGGIDLTNDLHDLMEQRAKEFDDATKRMPPTGKLAYMIQNSKNGGIIDIKRQEEWKLNPDFKYYFDNIELRKDDHGNILFGYVCAKHYPLQFLLAGAGGYQIIAGDTDLNETLGFWKTFFDDPRDQDMIEYGYRLYHKERNIDSYSNRKRK